MEISKDGTEWLAHTLKERREWFFSVVGVSAKIGICKDIKLEEAFRQVEDFYSNPENSNEVIQEVCKLPLF